MFGIKYIKARPTSYVVQYRNGSVVRAGNGQSFFYYAPSSTVLSIPVASQEESFMLELITGDFQSVTVQGQLTYRIAEPDQITTMLDFSLDGKGKHYASEDPMQLGQRVATQVEIIIQEHIQSRPLLMVLNAASEIAEQTQNQLLDRLELKSLGVEVQGVSIQGIKPTPDIARALEAEAREANLKSADDAVYARRIAAVRNEQSVREHELETEIAVQEKQGQIEEARLQNKAAVMEKENILRAGQLEADITLEANRRSLVESETGNVRLQAEAEAFRLEAMVAALSGVDARVIQSVISADMAPAQLIAQAFGGIADNAERIGQLNVSPDLLQGLLNKKTESAS